MSSLVTSAPSGKMNVPDPRRPDREEGAARYRSDEAISLRILRQTCGANKVEDAELTLCGGDESIDHHLRTVEEVSELREEESVRSRYYI